MSHSSDRVRLRAAEDLSADLSKATGYAATPTVDGRVVVYAPRAAGLAVLAVLAKVQERIRPYFRTARILDATDARLAVVEVSLVGR